MVLLVVFSRARSIASAAVSRLYSTHSCRTSHLSRMRTCACGTFIVDVMRLLSMRNAAGVDLNVVRGVSGAGAGTVASAVLTTDAGSLAAATCSFSYV